MWRKTCLSTPWIGLQVKKSAILLPLPQLLLKLDSSGILLCSEMPFKCPSTPQQTSAQSEEKTTFSQKSKETDLVRYPTNSGRLTTAVNSGAWPFFPLPNSEPFQQPQAGTRELFIKGILGALYCQDTL